LLAVVNGENIYASDLGPDVVQALADEKATIASLRRDYLNTMANTMLLKIEAGKRQMTLDALLDAEINGKLTTPPDADLQAFYNANLEQMQGQPFAAVKNQIIDYFKQQQAAKLQAALIKKLIAVTPVKAGVDVNTPNLPPTAVLASADTQSITADLFENKVAPFAYRKRMQLWNATMDVLDLKINEVLLFGEAKKRAVTPQQMLQTEVSAKVQAPADAEITKFYNDNKAQINGTLEQARAQISEYLMQQKQEELTAELVKRLRAGGKIEYKLPEPEPPVLPVKADDDPSRGPVNAPVTVIVFTDFQCPSCAAVHPILDAVTSEFGDKVRLVVRDYPLPKHKDARRAAEAANAANAQGKFFDYIAILFKNQNKQDVASLKAFAVALGLDRAKFDAELDSGKYAAEVEKDVQDGDYYGVLGTPTIFINGVRLEVLSSEAMRGAIQAALKKAGK
jgi:protein-disulfide isomerase